jgi:hypothetical protein
MTLEKWLFGPAAAVDRLRYASIGSARGAAGLLGTDGLMRAVAGEWADVLGPPTG